MSKITIAVIALLALGLGIYYFSGSLDGLSTTMDSGMQTEETADPITNNDKDRKMAFADVMRGGGSYQCEVVHGVGETSSEGWVYIDGDLIRSDFTSNAAGMTINSHSIMRDGYSYVWISESNTGVRVPLTDSEIEGDTDVAAEGSFSAFDPDQVGEYDCNSWVADNSLFTLPTSIEFTDFSASVPTF